MPHLTTRGRTAVAVATIPSSSGVGAQTSDRPTLAITHATVIDVVSGRKLPDRNVVLRNGRIASVGVSAPPRDARVIDGRGKFVIPGLWDMHAHLGNAGVATNVF